MRVDWSMLLTIFLAIILARIFTRALFFGNTSGSAGHVDVVTQNPAEPVVTYANPISEFIAIHHPNARN